MLLQRLFFTAILASLAVGWPVATEKRGAIGNAFLALIVKLFPTNILVNNACGALTAGQHHLSTAFNVQTTQNTSGCKDVTVIFARGTCDPGNVGALTGPPFFEALQVQLGSKSLNVQGIAYPASVEGYLSADPAAGKAMAGMVTSMRDACPRTKIVLSGYSQGGFAVHGAADILGSNMSSVSAVVTFGDPRADYAVKNIDPSNVLIVCHKGDNICEQGALILPQHLTYSVDAASAAAFVSARV